MSNECIVELDHVHKTFRQRQRGADLREALTRLTRPVWREVRALQNINLKIARGEIVAYAGPNGAGKSTTVKLCSALLAPDSGRVRVLGMDPVRDRVRYVSRIGVVFGQRSELWSDHPVSASFEWKRVVWDVPRERYERMKALVLDLLGIGEFFNSMVRELSLGQKMRADLGLALLHEPELLFLDEPTIGLDVLAKRRILQFIKELNREKYVTVMVTSHDMADLEMLSTRIVMIDHGRIAYDGSFDQLRREYADRRRLLIETSRGDAPQFADARWIRSDANRHEYEYDASRVSIARLLEQASAQAAVVDVETHRADIDELIADIYERWQARRSP